MTREPKQVNEPQKKRSFTRIVILFWVVFVFPFLFLGGMLFLASKSDLPQFQQLENPDVSQASEVYTADGELLGKYFNVNRNNVSFRDLSPNLVNALVATEDERYYSHSGIDFLSLPRVAYGVLSGNLKGGGSTITQQLSKMLFHKRPKSRIKRVFQKFQEWIIATQLERQYTKNEIIAMYLNQFDFINNAVGIKSATRIYFDTSPDSLKIEQAAMLVGMLKNPSLYNPLRREEMTLNRRNVVLFQMKRNEFITQEQYDSLKFLPIELTFTRQAHDEGLAPYFRAEMKKELMRIFNEKDSITGEYIYYKPDGSPYSIYQDGLRIYTTIHSKMQAYAEWAVSRHLGGELQASFERDVKRNTRPPFSNDLTSKEIQSIIQRSIRNTDRYRAMRKRMDGKVPKDSIDIEFNTPVPMRIFSWNGDIDTILSPIDSIYYYKSILQAGLMSVDPHTGFVKAWVGGINYKHFKYDHVKHGKRQVGSTFKPFIYTTAIRAGYSPCRLITKTPTTFEAGKYGLLEPYTPEDDDNDYGFPVSLKWGLANSVNTVTAWVMYQFGPQATVDLARSMGITSKLDAVPSLSYGVSDLSLYELTGALSTFANKGMHIDPIIIARIENKNGNVIYTAKPKMNVAVDEQTAYVMLSLMQGTVDGVYNAFKGTRTGTAIRLKLDVESREYDGIPKDYAIAGKTGTTQNQSDGWFVGITPDLVTGVWVGAEDRSVHFRGITLGQGANTALPIWGYYMKKVYDDPGISLEKKTFEPPQRELTIDIDCENNPSSFDFNTQEFTDPF
jgi:penicillin-binding protein 1A